MVKLNTVLICCHNLDVSGANAIPLNLVTGCQSSSTHFVVHAPTPGPFAQRFLENGATVFVGLTVDEILSRLGTVRAAFCNSILSAHMVLKLEERGVPCMWVLHEWWPADVLPEQLRMRNNKNVTQEIVDGAMSRATRVVPVCERQRDLYSPSAASTVVYVGVPEPGRGVGDPPAPDRPVTFLCLGLVCPRKGQLFAVQIFKAFAGSRTDVRLLVVGVRRTRAYESEYADRVAEEIGGDPRIELHDVTTDVDKFYRQADAMLFTSTNEVTPCVISEAMSYSMPVITTNIAGIPEMIEDGVEGFLIEPGDEARGVECVTRLYDSAELRADMGRRGRAKYEAKFSLDAMVSNYDRVLSEISTRPVVLVDMDGCLVDWDAGFVRAWRERGPIERTRYKMEDCVPPAQRDEAMALMRMQGFFLGLPPAEGGLQALRDMVAEGFEVVVCTSPILDSNFCAQEKYQWIIRHLGQEWARRVVLTADKTVVDGAVLIDDKPAISGINRTPAWEHIVFDAPYNAGTGHRVRMSCWADWRLALQQAFSLRPEAVTRASSSESLSDVSSQQLEAKDEPSPVSAEDVAKLPDFRDELSGSTRTFYESYRNWRSGASKGAKGEVSDATGSRMRLLQELAYLDGEGYDETMIYRTGYAQWRRGKARGARGGVRQA